MSPSQESSPAGAATPEPAAHEKPAAPTDQIVETQHVVTIGGREIPYAVTTGTIVLKEESEKQGDKAGESEGEKPKATVFFIAYRRTDVSDPAKRPLTFSFNGGPG